MKIAILYKNKHGKYSYITKDNRLMFGANTSPPIPET